MKIVLQRGQHVFQLTNDALKRYLDLIGYKGEIKNFPMNQVQRNHPALLEVIHEFGDVRSVTHGSLYTMTINNNCEDWKITRRDGIEAVSFKVPRRKKTDTLYG